MEEDDEDEDDDDDDEVEEDDMEVETGIESCGLCPFLLGTLLVPESCLESGVRAGD